MFLFLLVLINNLIDAKNLTRFPDYDTFCYCGWTNKDRNRIIGGTESKLLEWPMMVGIVTYVDLKHLCGGTIITRHHVLTASHCFFDKTGNAIPLETLSIIVGVHNYAGVKKSDVLKIREAVHHPEYVFGKSTPDLTVLLIDYSLYNGVTLGPACLPKKRLNPLNKKFRHLGWGSVKVGSNKTSNVLKKTVLNGIDIRSCNYGQLIDLKNRFQICTRQRGTSPCFGDSGGPLMWLDTTTKKYSIIGVVSFAKERCLDGPTVSTEIFNFITWIKYVTSDYKGIFYIIMKYQDRAL